MALSTMNPYLPPNYALHDDSYRRLRERGKTGWDDDEVYADMFRLVAPALPAAAPEGSPSVLEIGSGAGNFSLMLARHGYRLTGVEISQTAVDWANESARATGSGAVFRVDDVLALASCGDATFDAVVDGHCLHCIIGLDRASCLRSVLRVLKPGGVFVVLTMSGDVLDEALLRVFDPVNKVTVHGGRPTRYIGSAEDIVAEVVGAGFEISESTVHRRTGSRDLDHLVIHAVKPA